MDDHQREQADGPGVPGELAILGQGSMDQMRTVRRLLGERGLSARLVAPPEGCGSA